MAEIPDVMEAAKNVVKLKLENNRARVLETRIRPGKKAPMHNHPHNHVVYFMANARLKLTFPDGKSDKLNVKAGQTIWMQPGSHETENVGKTVAHYLVVELKATPEKAASLSDSS